MYVYMYVCSHVYVCTVHTNACMYFVPLSVHVCAHMHLCVFTCKHASILCVMCEVSYSEEHSSVLFILVVLASYNPYESTSQTLVYT